MNYNMEDGVYNVMVTPFDETGSVDCNSYVNMLENLVNNNPMLRGIVILGTTSEAPTLSMSEKMNIVNITRSIIGNRLQLVIGVGGNNTYDTIEFARQCEPYADIFMLTTPYYNKPSQEGMYRHFVEICQNEALVRKAMMLYNIPSRCGVNLLPETIERLVNDCPNIVAIKEASGSMDAVVKIRERTNIKIFVGDDALILPVMSLGGNGVISVASNVVPRHICEIVESCRKNDYDRARDVYYRVVPLIRSLFCETNPVPVKYLLSYLGAINRDLVRLPLVPMQDNNKKSELEYNYMFATRRNNNENAMAMN